MGAILDGINNLLSGGTWSQSGGEIATQNFNAQQAALQREYEAQQAQIARDFSAMEAAKNRDFQERMARSSYQYAVEDLKAAGLNPYLAYQQGGASAPAGSVAQSFSAHGSAASGSHNNSKSQGMLDFAQSALSVATLAAKLVPLLA